MTKWLILIAIQHAMQHGHLRIHHYIYHCLRRTAKVILIGWFVTVYYVYVCLLCNITENAWTDFGEIFRIGRTWLQEHLVTFKGGDSEGTTLFHAWLDYITLLQIGAVGFALS